ncbi:hypothetical protein Cni_G02439 [Canna indica]|uniref:BED-type domain-containing protein n=1 Tax=Canna indica TaxID=4628 RepID=A0AAQ3JP87_9LILI|nr:hypothetical protein Cni_G02439 [Canna indica]
MTPKSQADPAWQHGRRLEKAHHWQCLHCDMISRGGGITQLKQHLAGGYPDVVNCSKVPSEVRKMFKAQLNKPSSIDEFPKMSAVTIMRLEAAITTRMQNLKPASELHWSISITNENGCIIPNLNSNMTVAVAAVA